MQHHADWESFYDRRLDWAKEARTNLVEDCIHHDIFFFEDHTEESEMMISVYGKSQRGKTTCILSLLGIQEEQVKIVSDILRGSREKGTSATSTATIYKKSATDFFGLEVKGQNSMDITDEDFKIRIDAVREEIERFPGSIDQITILLPRKYFVEEEKSFAYRIVDLPGIESAEEREQDHVVSIVEKYLKSSDSILIIELANALTDLGSTSFSRQGIEIWSKRFKVILTRSFSLESIKSLVLGKSEDEIYSNLKNYYEEEVRRSLKGKIDKNLEIYPMEFGESLIEFTSAYPECKSAVYSVLNRLKIELLKSVSETLTVEDKIMESVNMTNTIQKQLKEQKEEKNKYLKGMNKKLERSRKYISDEDGLKDKLRIDKVKLAELVDFIKYLKEWKSVEEPGSIEAILPFIIKDDQKKPIEISMENNKIKPSIRMREVNLPMLEEDIKNTVNDRYNNRHEKFKEELYLKFKEFRVIKKVLITRIKKYEEEHIHQNTLEIEIRNLIEALFPRKLLWRYLGDGSLELYRKFVEEWDMICNIEQNDLMKMLAKDFMPILNKEKRKLGLNISTQEDEIRAKELAIKKLEENIERKEKEYEDMIIRYEHDAKIVSKFHDYLSESFQKEYNATTKKINKNIEPLWNLVFAKLITDKYEYFTNKLENKYGKTIR